MYNGIFSEEKQHGGNLGKYPEFYMGYIDKTWYVGSSALKYYLCVLSFSMCILKSSFAYSLKGSPCCIFCEYSERVS